LGGNLPPVSLPGSVSLAKTLDDIGDMRIRGLNDESNNCKQRYTLRTSSDAQFAVYRAAAC
jgi:hypothetical protein